LGWNPRVGLLDKFRPLTAGIPNHTTGKYPSSPDKSTRALIRAGHITSGCRCGIVVDSCVRATEERELSLIGSPGPRAGALSLNGRARHSSQCVLLYQGGAATEYRVIGRPGANTSVMTHQFAENCVGA